MPTATRKLRGFPRYLRRLRAASSSFSLRLTDDNWFDLWHYHFDVIGYGRQDWALRLSHLEALFVAFERVLSQVQSSGARLQVFVSIAPMSKAEQDALYVHGPNPNGTPFPYAYAGVEWDVAPPAFLKPFVVGKGWQLGAANRPGQTWWVIRARDEVAVHTAAVDERPKPRA